jgi:hypothetical protein
MMPPPTLVIPVTGVEHPHGIDAMIGEQPDAVDAGAIGADDKGYRFIDSDHVIGFGPRDYSFLGSV